MAFPTGYSKYQEITIDATKVNADLTDFVVYLDLSELVKAGADLFDTCRTDGGDIRITKSDGTTELARDIVNIDTTAKTGQVHVKFAGTLSSSTDTVIRIWYNGTDTEPTASSTYGSENVWTGYDLVAHCGEDPSGSAPQILDSTANSIDGTSAGSMTSGDSVTGKLPGKALQFDGINDRIQFGAGTDLDVTTGDVSVSGWVRMDAIATDGVWGKHNGAGGAGEGYHMYTSGTNFYSKVGDGGASVNGQSATISASTWYYLAMDWDGSANVLETFLNNNVPDSDTSSVGSLSDTSIKFAIGDRGHGLYGNATMQEIRVKLGLLGEDWHDTQYANQNSASTFYSTGDELESGISKALAVTAQASTSIAFGFFTDLATTAQATASVLKGMVKTLATTASATAGILKRISHDITATAQATASLAKTLVTPVVLAVTAQASTALSKIGINAVTLAVTAQATIDIGKIKSLVMTLSATAQATPGLVKSGIVIMRSLATTASATISMSRGLVLSKILSATASAVVGMLEDFGYIDKYPENDTTYSDKYPES